MYTCNVQLRQGSLVVYTYVLIHKEVELRCLLCFMSFGGRSSEVEWMKHNTLSQEGISSSSSSSSTLNTSKLHYPEALAGFLYLSLSLYPFSIFPSCFFIVFRYLVFLADPLPAAAAAPFFLSLSLFPSRFLCRCCC